MIIIQYEPTPDVIPVESLNYLTSTIPNAVEESKQVSKKEEHTLPEVVARRRHGAPG